MYVVGVVYTACSFPRTWKPHEKHQVSFVQIADLLLILNLIVIGEIKGDLVAFGISKSEYCGACTQYFPLSSHPLPKCKTSNVLLGAQSSII